MAKKRHFTLLSDFSRIMQLASIETPWFPEFQRFKPSLLIQDLSQQELLFSQLKVKAKLKTS